MIGKLHFNIKVALSFFVMMAGLLFFSCTNFFSNSWASWAARDYNSLIPNVTAGNVSNLASLFEDDPDGSLALLKKIQSAVNGNPSAADLLILQSAALEVAVNSVGLVNGMLAAAGNMSDFDNVDDARSILDAALNAMSNLEEAGSLLAAILPNPPAINSGSGTLDENDPEYGAFMNFAKSASADDLAMAAVVLLLGEASKFAGDLDEFLEDLSV